VGVSAGTRKTAARLIPKLVMTPAATRFLSCEPLLEEMDLSEWISLIHWVIAGGESGHRYRPLDLDAARSLRDQCLRNSVPFWFKQVGGLTHNAGGDLLDGRRWKELPVSREGVLV
jgi:protein gp37